MRWTFDAATTRRDDDATRDYRRRDDDATTDRIDRASRGVARAASNARLPSIDRMPFCDAATDRMRPTPRSRRTARSTDVVIEIEPKAPRSIGAIEPRRVDRTIVESRDRP